jgi:probable HAF family extracellular repeat protein
MRTREVAGLIARLIAALTVGATFAAPTPAAAAVPAAPARPGFSIVGPVALSAPRGTIGGEASDINERGQISGYVTVRAASRWELDQPVRWEPSGHVTMLPPAPAEHPTGKATRINEAGIVAGKTTTAKQGDMVRMWWPDGTFRDCAIAAADVIELNAKGEALTSNTSNTTGPGSGVCERAGTGATLSLTYAHAIDEQGQAAGTIVTAPNRANPLGFRRPALQRAGAAPMLLPIPAGKSGEAIAFGPRGEVFGVIGSMRTGSFGTLGTGPTEFQIERAVVWRGPDQVTAEPLGGPSFVPNSTDGAINRRGDIIGTRATASGKARAVLWRSGHLTDLGTLGGPSSQPNAINDLGQVVGISKTADGDNHAFFWADGRMADLGTLAGRGDQLAKFPLAGSSADDINNRGQIVGLASRADGRYYAVTWSIAPAAYSSSAAPSSTAPAGPAAQFPTAPTGPAAPSAAAPAGRSAPGPAGRSTPSPATPRNQPPGDRDHPRRPSGRKSDVGWTPIYEAGSHPTSPERGTAPQRRRIPPRSMTDCTHPGAINDGLRGWERHRSARGHRGGWGHGGGWGHDGGSGHRSEWRGLGRGGHRGGGTEAS